MTGERGRYEQEGEWRRKEEQLHQDAVSLLLRRRLLRRQRVDRLGRVALLPRQGSSARRGLNDDVILLRDVKADPAGDFAARPADRRLDHARLRVMRDVALPAEASTAPRLALERAWRCRVGRASLRREKRVGEVSNRAGRSRLSGRDGSEGRVGRAGRVG